MLPAELIKKIRQIEIYTSRAVNAAFAGRYESVFKGRGMQFDEVREYMPGDDIRSIDWNVTARTGTAHIKRYVEEREMTVIFAVDLSAGGEFGTVNRVKNELAAEFCAVLAFAAIRNNDKAGLVIFTDEIELFIPPKKGSAHVLRLIRELLYFKAPGKKTDIPPAIDYLNRVLKKRAIVFVVSDFFCEGYKKPMSLLNRKHDVVAVNVNDPSEIEIPRAGLVELTDAETGKAVLADTSSVKFRRQYQKNAQETQNRLKETLRSISVDFIDISTARPYMQDIIKFFHMRHSRQ